MDTQARIQQARQFLALHTRGKVLLLPNAWDAGSARMFASLGFDAIATTSGGVSWSQGYADGEHLPLDDLLAVVRRMAAVTALPLTVDFEGGHGDSPAAVAANVRQVIEAGAVGINLEDGIRHETLRDTDDAAQRIAAAREAARETGVPLVINARVDTWIVGGDASDEDLIEDTLRRARAYLDAGADVIFPIGVATPESIATLCERIDAPVNIAARTGLPDLAGLGRLGVARVSTATRLATVAYSAAHAAAAQLQRSGRFDGLDASLDYGRMQQLFETPPDQQETAP